MLRVRRTAGPLNWFSADCLAKGHGKPVLHVDLGRLDRAEAVRKVRAWVGREGVSTLNVAGSREGTVAGLRRQMEEIPVKAFGG